MPVEINTASNKVPPKVGCPDQELFPTKLVMKDGSVIWRSIPQPDTINFKAVLTKEHFGGKGKAPEVNPERIAELSEMLAAAQFASIGTHPFIPMPLGFAKKFTLALGLREATLYIELAKEKVKDFPAGGWAILFDMTARKVQPGGMDEFLDILHFGTPNNFNVPALLRDCRVTRLDVAVDYAGVEPADLIATLEKPGKRSEYFGADGALETVNLARFKAFPKKALKKKPKQPLGTVVAKLYDRNRERQSVGKPAPYPGTALTRLEVVLKPKPKTNTYLIDVPALPDPLGDVRLSLARTALRPAFAHWLTFVAAVRALGRERATATLKLDTSLIATFNNGLEKHPSDLLKPGSVWPLWADGLSKTGLSAVIEVAKSAGA